MLNKVIYLLLGIILFMFGLLRVIRKDYRDFLYNYGIDFGPYHHWLGIFIMMVGILFVYFSLRKKSKDFKDGFLICPKCEETFNKKDVPDQQCPKCTLDLEDVEGFYEKHPELKVKKTNF